MLKLNNIWNDSHLPTELKTRLIKALIWPIAIYSCESWTLNKREEDMLQAFEMWTYRRMLRISYKEHRTNEWILNKAGKKRQLLNQVKRLKLRYFGHIKRSKGLENTIMEGRVDGNRIRGRQRARWIDNIRTWTGRELHEVGTIARNRVDFRHDIINALDSV